jgi:hypothetical protein
MAWIFNGHETSWLLKRAALRLKHESPFRLLLMCDISRTAFYDVAKLMIYFVTQKNIDIFVGQNNQR